MTFQEALYELGVRNDTLSQEDKNQLDVNGFLLLHNLIPREIVSQLCDARARVIQRTEPEVRVDGMGIHLYTNIQNEDKAFDICFLQPKVLASIYHVIKKPFRSIGIQTNVFLPGSIGVNMLHSDYLGSPLPPHCYIMCNTIWLLSDFTRDNGCTRVVPGSHRWGRTPQEVIHDPTQSHPQEVLLTGELGSVIIFNGHIWHSATKNKVQQERMTINSFWRTIDYFGSKKDAHWGTLNRHTCDRLLPQARQLFLRENV